MLSNEIIGILGIVLFLIPFIFLILNYVTFLKILSAKNNRKYTLSSETSYLKFINIYYIIFFPISFLFVDINKLRNTAEFEAIYKLYLIKIRYETLFWGAIILNGILAIMFFSFSSENL